MIPGNLVICLGVRKNTSNVDEPDSVLHLEGVGRVRRRGIYSRNARDKRLPGYRAEAVAFADVHGANN